LFCFNIPFSKRFLKVFTRLKERL